MRHNKHNTGAALVVAIAVLTVLLAIALTFFTVSRLEVKTSTNVENSVRADLLSDSAVAIAMSFLRHDAAIHPSFTSLDHAWRTYFNGSWVQQKLYAWPDQYANAAAFTSWGGYQTGGIPQIFATEELDPYTGMQRAGGGLTGHLYVPRREVYPADPRGHILNPYNYKDEPANPDPTEIYNPFVIPTLPGVDGGVGFAVQVVDSWADVDNDGDGYRDSVWLPLVADIAAGNILDGDGEVITPGDGVNNDLDGVLDIETGISSPPLIDEPQSQDVFNSIPAAEAGSIEPLSFLYYGGNDGLDNDGDGLIDARAAGGGPGDMRWFLTAPMCHTLKALGEIQIVYVTLSNVTVSGASIEINTDPNLPWPNNDADLYDGQHRWVDVIDNDYDLVTNEHFEYLTPIPGMNDETPKDPVYIEYLARIREYNQAAKAQNWPVRVVKQSEFNDLRGYSEICTDYLGGGSASQWRIKASGEPVCEIVGRAAILITDESSKVNLNAAGAHALDLAKIRLLENPNHGIEIPRDDLYEYGAVAGNFTSDAARFRAFLAPALFPGPSAMNYCTALLPDTGDIMGKYLWNLMTGVPQGWLEKDGAPLMLSENTGDPFRGFYYTDALLPGYGMVDDNANALLLSLNGIDDDGDGLVDEGINNGQKLTDAQIDDALAFADRNHWFDIPELDYVFFGDYTRKGLAQKIYQLHLGLLEGVDEPGELQSRRPLRNLIAEGKEQDPSTGYDQYNNSGPANNIVNEFGELGDRVLRTREEIKNIGLNKPTVEGPTGTFTPETMANNYFNLVKPYITLHSTDSETRYGATGDSANEYSGSLQPAQGVRLNLNFATAQEITEALVNDWNMSPLYWPVDPALPAADRETAYFLYGLKREDWSVIKCPLVVDENNNPQMFPADPQLRAAQMAVNIRDAADTDFVRSELKIGAQFPVNDTENPRILQYDPWWHLVTDDGSGVTGEERPINYTQAGCEAIRITEMMVRPVRRVEPEANIVPGPPDATSWLVGERYDPNMLPRFYNSDGSAVPSFDTGKYTMQTAFDALRAAYPGDFNNVEPPAARGELYWPEPWADYPWNPINSRSIGDGMVYISQRRAIAVQRVAEARIENWPNVIEFRFGPSTELPPGRYYLTLNTRDAFGNITVYKPGQLLYATKYVRAINDDGELDELVEIYPGTDPVYTDVKGRTIVDDVLEWCADAAHWDTSTIPAELIDGTSNDLFMFRELEDSYLGRENTNAAKPPLTGQIFLGTNPAPDTTVPTTAIRKPLYAQDAAFTITIPEYSATPANQVYLHVAFALGPDCGPFATPELILTDNIDNDLDGVLNDGPGVPAGSMEANIEDTLDNDGDGVFNEVPWPAINSFDFSQEPDHEWVEIENISGRDIDIAGWKLTVGADDGKGNMVSDDAVEMTIPLRQILTGDPMDPVDYQPRILSGTPPNNRMLLAVNAFDFAASDFETALPWQSLNDIVIEAADVVNNMLLNNGIGLWGADDPRDNDADPLTDDLNFAGITVPPIPGRRALFDGVVSPGSDGLGELAYGPSIFERNDPRIVQVEVDGLTNVPITSVDDVAKWVLRGGVFPNYPEHDGVDNDNDNAVLTTDGVDNNGNAFELQTNGDDDGGEGSVTDDPFEGVDELAEGVDEGRYFRHNGIFPAPGAFSILPVPYAYARTNIFNNVIADRFPQLAPTDVGTDYYYPLPHYGYLGQPLEWKTFVERRFYPGDCVIVSLLQTIPDGTETKILGVVDRVTYTESDVVNRVTSDRQRDLRDYLGDAPFDDEWQPVLDSDELVWEPLREWLAGAPSFIANPTMVYTTLWPDNTMGVDFYRTLERKGHPFYNGDRFGTQNRWQPTDGNYDDWSHDPVKREPWELEMQRTGSMFNLLNIDPNDEFALRCDAPIKFSGSPLERNAAAVDLTRGDMLELKKDADNVQLASRPFVGPSDAVFVPGFSAWTRFENPVQPVHGNSDSPSYYKFPAFEGLNSLCVGKPSKDLLPLDGEIATNQYLTYAADRDALQAIGASNFTVLSPGQADVHSLYPTRADYGFNDDDDWLAAMAWDTTTLPVQLPEVWAPVFLYPLLPAADRFEELNIVQSGLQPGERGLRYRYNVASADGLGNTLVPLPYNTAASASQFLYDGLLLPSAFQASASDPLNLTALWTRWPVQKRTALFVSGNIATFDPALVGHPAYNPGDTLGPFSSYNNVRAAEVLFVWDAEDGVEDGEYNVYIDTGGTLEELAKTANPGTVADALCDLAAKTPASEVAVDIELFTDLNNDGRCWQPGDGNSRIPPTRTNLDRFVTRVPIDGVLTTTKKSESFGARHGCTPDYKGLIHYGVVRVQNNYLALDLRNWSAPGKLCKFTGLILAPRDRNPGRINVNTAQSRPYVDEGDRRVFNPLMGLPGLLPETSPALNWSDYTCTVGVNVDATAQTNGVDFGVAFRHTGNSFYWYRIQGAGTDIVHRLYRVVNGDAALIYEHYVSPTETGLVPDYGDAATIRVTPSTHDHDGDATTPPITLFDIRFNGTMLPGINRIANPANGSIMLETANPTGAVGLWSASAEIHFTDVLVNDGSPRPLLNESFSVVGATNSYPCILAGWTGENWVPDMSGRVAIAPDTGASFMFYAGEYALNPDSTTPPLLAAGSTNMPVPADTRPPLPNDDAGQQYARYDRARRIEIARPSYWDGRYYKNKADLLTDKASIQDPNYPGDESKRLYALSNINKFPDDRERENAWRFARLANQITTRSDVFEIIVTVQSGYGNDENGDGIINYRSHDEFVITAEKKTRTVYER